MKYCIFFLVLVTSFFTNCSLTDVDKPYLEKKAEEYKCLDLANNVNGLHLHGHTWTNIDYVVIDKRINGPYMVFCEGNNKILLLNYGTNDSYSYKEFETYLDDVIHTLKIYRQFKNSLVYLQLRSNNANQE